MLEVEFEKLYTKIVVTGVTITEVRVLRVGEEKKREEKVWEQEGPLG